MSSLRSVVCHTTLRFDMHVIRIRRQGGPRVESQKSEGFQVMCSGNLQAHWECFALLEGNHLCGNESL